MPGKPDFGFGIVGPYFTLQMCSRLHFRTSPMHVTSPSPSQSQTIHSQSAITHREPPQTSCSNNNPEPFPSPHCTFVFLSSTSLGSYSSFFDELSQSSPYCRRRDSTGPSRRNSSLSRILLWVRQPALIPTTRPAHPTRYPSIEAQVCCRPF